MIRHSAIIRTASSDDFAAVCRLVSGPEEMFLAFPASRFPLSEKQLRRLAEQRCDLTVAADGDEIVGFADLYDLCPGRWGFIGNLIVASSQRGRGIGSGLVEHMLGLVFDLHALPVARLSVFEHNTPALRLYTRMGFIPYADEQRRDQRGRPVSLLHLERGR